MAKKLTFEEIKGSIINKKFSSVYLLQGEESYFIDQLTDLLLENVLEDSERDFNQTMVYGVDANVANIINVAKRYPMMSKYQLVVVKEAQALKQIDELIHYVNNPLKSTILVLNYKNGKMDGRKKLSSTIDKVGILFEAKRIYENKIPAFISSYLQDKQVTIEPKAAQMMTDFLGNKLSQICNELDKLIIYLPENQKRITPELIEQNIGISKDFNNFELQSALASRDIVKANRIINYFDKNAKNNPLLMSLSVLYNFFSNLMICHFQANKSESQLMNVLGLRFDFQVTDYIHALKIYSPTKTMQIVELIRLSDAKSKGVGNAPATDNGQLLRELTYKIMH
ncbi:DNA polymerase III subunit delta [Bacteroidales bacterium]|nr:DNA polymerase III subunit delta [Bacteroidales bacterium]